MLELICQPWPWYVAGPMITLVMFSLLFLGKNFGVSYNLRTLCAIGGAGKVSDFFKFDWKTQAWNLIFVLGGIIGGFIATQFLTNNEPLTLSPMVIEELKNYGIANPGVEMLPEEIFTFEALTTPRGFIMLVLGGFLVGFGTRYAGGCTSGHAISGLSDLQIPSLIAVVGFLFGGFFVTYFVLPHILTL